MKYFLIALFLMTTQAEAAKIKVHLDSPNGVILTYRGKVEIGDAAQLTKLMDKYAHRDKIVLYLHSEGGLLYPAIRLGRTIRHFGITTAIG